MIIVYSLINFQQHQQYYDITCYNLIIFIFISLKLDFNIRHIILVIKISIFILKFNVVNQTIILSIYLNSTIYYNVVMINH